MKSMKVKILQALLMTALLGYSSKIAYALDSDAYGCQEVSQQVIDTTEANLGELVSGATQPITVFGMYASTGVAGTNDTFACYNTSVSLSVKVGGTANQFGPKLNSSSVAVNGAAQWEPAAPPTAKNGLICSAVTASRPGIIVYGVDCSR